MYLYTSCVDGSIVYQSIRDLLELFFKCLYFPRMVSPCVSLEMMMGTVGQLDW